MTAVTDRVAAGAAFLDEHDPQWVERIDLERLSIASSCRCILGQLHGSFSAGLLAIGWPSRVALNVGITCGFMWNPDQLRSDREQESDELTAEWKRVITERRAAS